MITTYEVMDVVQSIFTAFEAPIFMALTLMISFSVAWGFKRLALE
jgi:hypothetical protein